MPTLSDHAVLSLGAVLARQGDDVAALGRLWQRQVDAAVSRWQAEVSPQQQASAERQIESAVHAQSLDQLAALAVPPLGAAALLESARTMAGAGAAAVLDEARAAGLELAAAPPLAAVTLADWAELAAQVLADGFAAGVAREAARLFRPGARAADVVDGVRAYLRQLTDRPLRDTIGALLTKAQNLGRLQVYARPVPGGWTLQLIADEQLDERTCEPCEKIDGTVLPTVDAASLAYGGAGYLWCLGRERCRGTMRGVWAPVRGADDLLRHVLNRTYKRDKDGKFSRTGGGGAVSRLKELADTVAAAKQLDDNSEHWHRLTGGASGSGVRMATLPGGRRVVHKKAPDWGSDEPRTQADAEDLASLTAMLLGADAAAVQRDDDESSWVEHIPGKTYGQAQEEGGKEAATFAAFRSSAAGARLGLLDVLIGNNDRNDGNLIISPDGDVVGIDHAYAFEMIGYERGKPHPQDLGRMGGDHAPAGRYITCDDDGQNSWSDNPMTPGDVVETRRRLEFLRPAYERRGRTKWLDNAFAMLDQLAEHATGTESIYGD